MGRLFSEAKIKKPDNDAATDEEHRNDQLQVIPFSGVVSFSLVVVSHNVLPALMLERRTRCILDIRPIGRPVNR